MALASLRHYFAFIARSFPLACPLCPGGGWSVWALLRLPGSVAGFSGQRNETSSEAGGDISEGNRIDDRRCVWTFGYGEGAVGFASSG